MSFLLSDARAAPTSAKFFTESVPAIAAVIAAVTHNRAELVKESADLLYHLLVVLKAEGVPLSEVMGELDARTAQSGLAEKAARKDTL